WGTEKRMISPYLLQGPDSLWHCVWSLNERDRLFGHAASADLVHWKRQSYPAVEKGDNFLRPVVQYDKEQALYTITYTSADNRYYRIRTKDFKTYSPAREVPASQYTGASQTVTLPAGQATGQVH